MGSELIGTTKEHDGFKVTTTAVEPRKGYELRTETIEWEVEGTREKLEGCIAAYTPEGHRIGNAGDAAHLVHKHGIVPEMRTPDSRICSIGFRAADQKWYGWSHRALCGFGIGDKLFTEDFAGATEDTLFVQHGDVTIETLEQAKEAASNFAQSVS